MSTDLIVKSEWGSDQLELLKRTICKGASDDEFQLFVHVAKRSGLDPFAKQIHAVKRWNSKENRFDMAIQTGIDGYRLIADRTGLYAGSDDAVFDNEEAPTKATVTVYKLVKGTRCAFTATARWNEYYPGDKQGMMWKKMPCVMLGKVAESLALRKAFPADLSNIYVEEEMEQAGEPPKYGDNKEEPKTVVSEPEKKEEPKPTVRTRGVIVAELMVEVRRIEATNEELAEWSNNLFGKSVLKDLTIQELERFLLDLRQEPSPKKAG